MAASAPIESLDFMADAEAAAREQAAQAAATRKAKQAEKERAKKDRQKEEAKQRAAAKAQARQAAKARAAEDQQRQAIRAMALESDLPLMSHVNGNLRAQVQVARPVPSLLNSFMGPGYTHGFALQTLWVISSTLLLHPFRQGMIVGASPGS